MANSGLRLIDGEEAGVMHVRSNWWNATANRDTHIAWCGVVETTVVGAAPKYMVDDQDEATCRACEDSMAVMTIDEVKKKEKRS